MPKYQAKFCVNVDVDDARQKLCDKGFKLTLGGGRPSRSGESPEAQVTVKFKDSSTTALISKSRIQINYVLDYACVDYLSHHNLYEAVEILQKHLGIEHLLKSFCDLKVPQSEVPKMKHMIGKLVLENIQLNEKFEDLSNVVLNLFDDLQALNRDAETDPEIKEKIRHVRKRACEGCAKVWASVTGSGEPTSIGANSSWLSSSLAKWREALYPWSRPHRAQEQPE